jgi:tripartite-type tricarboxylate transporter receptor subunit TctC
MKMHTTRRTVLAAIAGGTLLPHAWAQDRYPSRPIRIIVTNAAGGASDMIARMIATGLTTTMGQPVVVDPQPAANGMIALAALSKAAPDGYTLCVTHSAVVTNEIFQPNKPYHLAQIQPIAMVGTVATAMAVHPSMGVNTIPEFVAKVRAMRGAMSYGSFGNGSTGHVLGEMLKRSAKIDMTHVAYKGATPAVSDLIAGHIPAAWAGLQNFAPHIASGKLKVIGLAGKERHPSFPDVPTFMESGYNDMVLPSLAGVLAPVGLPKPVADRLIAEIAKIARSPEFTGKLFENAYHPVVLTGDQFADYIRSDIRVWGAAVKANDIRVD